MTVQQQRKRQACKQLIERRVIIASVAILFLGIAVVLWILSGTAVIQGAWSNFFSILFVFASVLIGLFQWLFPVHSPAAEPPAPVAPAVTPLSSAPLMLTLTPVLSPQAVPVTPALEKVVYRGIMGLPPPTDARTIQQREKAVRDIYARLGQPTTSAVVLTGIGGVGKSTLAALVYKYAEEQRQQGQGPFSAPAIWLNVDPAVTMADLAGNLCEIFGKPLPDLSNLSLQHQALALFNILNTPDERRLLVLDQFENLLDWQTGHALADRPGVGEWLDALNSQPCRSRLLMTTRPWPLGTREYPPTCMQEYTVRRLEPEEGIDLLRKFGVEASDEALYAIVERCGGHAFALTLLAALLRNRKLTLATFLHDTSYEHVWSGNVARNLLDEIYTSQLNEIQRKLLLAFSVYREPVALEAARALCDFVTPVSGGQIQQALDGLLAQHLLQAVGDGSYQLHAIVQGYAHDHFAPHDDQANEQALCAVHARAAQHYLQVASRELPPDVQRRRLSDYDPLIEATWQYCQAHQWREAYHLLEREQLFTELKILGGLVIALELYKLLLPLSKWQDVQDTSHEGARIYNYLGSIYRSLGRKELAMQHLEQAQKLAKEAGDVVEAAWSLNHQGRLYASMGEKERARACYEEALERAREQHERILQAAALNNLGWIYSAWGKLDEERACYNEALEIYRELGDRAGEAALLSNLGRVNEDAGEYDQAQKHYQEALALFQAAGNRRGEGWTLNNLGRSSYFLADDKQHAREYLEEALRIRREVDRRGEGRTLNNLGAVAGGDGDYLHAVVYCLEALEIVSEVADREGRGKIYHNFGQICLVQKRYAEALAFLLCARSILEEVQSPGREKLLDSIDRLHQEVGDERFFELLSSVEPRADLLVEQYLSAPQAQGA
jgi:tetratricopeptide (TPR) repeat protein